MAEVKQRTPAMKNKRAPLLYDSGRGSIRSTKKSESDVSSSAFDPKAHRNVTTTKYDDAASFPSSGPFSAAPLRRGVAVGDSQVLHLRRRRPPKLSVGVQLALSEGGRRRSYRICNRSRKAAKAERKTAPLCVRQSDEFSHGCSMWLGNGIGGRCCTNGSTADDESSIACGSLSNPVTRHKVTT